MTEILSGALGTVRLCGVLDTVGLTGRLSLAGSLVGGRSIAFTSVAAFAPDAASKAAASVLFAGSSSFEPVYDPPSDSASVAFASSSFLLINAVSNAASSVACSGTGALACVSGVRAQASVAFSGVATMAPEASAGAEAAATFVGSASLYLATEATASASAAFTAAGMFSPDAALPAGLASVAFAGTAALAPVASAIAEASCTLTGEASLVPIASATVGSAGAFAATSALAPASAADAKGSVAISGNASLTTIATAIAGTSVPLDGTAAFAPASQATGAAVLSLVGGGALVTASTADVASSVAFAGTATFSPAGTGGESLAVEITAPSPTAALYSGVTQEISGTYTGSPTEIKAYWDDEYTELAGTSTDIGSGTWSLDVVPVYAQVGFTTLYVRAYDGDGYAYDTLAITVTQRGPMDLFAAERSYHAADDSGCTLSGGTPNKFEIIPDAKIATSDSRLYQTSDSIRWLVRSSDSNFAGRRTAYVDSAFGNDIVFLPGSTSQVFGQRSSGKVTTIVLGCCESSSGAIGLLQTGTGGSYGAGRYSDGTLLFADGGSPRTTSHTLRVDVPFALRVEWDDTNNLANWYIYYDDGVTASGSVTWSTAADYAGMYIGSTDYGWYGAFCEILAIDGALGAGEWDAFVAQWLRGRMNWT